MCYFCAKELKPSQLVQFTKLEVDIAYVRTTYTTVVIADELTKIIYDATSCSLIVKRL